MLLPNSTLAILQRSRSAVCSSSRRSHCPVSASCAAPVLQGSWCGARPSSTAASRRSTSTPVEPPTITPSAEVIDLPPPADRAAFFAARDPFASAVGKVDQEESSSGSSSSPSPTGPASRDTESSEQAAGQSQTHNPIFDMPSPDEQGESGDPGTAVARVPMPNPWGFTPRRVKHPFDSHAFVSRLEKSEIDPDTARILMEGTRDLLITRSTQATANTLSKEELDNEAYLWKAALSKLQTEYNVRYRNAVLAMRADVTAVRRELDSVEQKLAEEMQVLKHDVEIDVNDRKSETRAEIKSIDIKIEDINNRATISMGDVRTEIESAKWDATRRAISIILVLVVLGVGISTVAIPDTAEAPKPATTTTTAPPPPATRDIGVGPDEDMFDYEARIDTLLKSVEREQSERRERRERRERERQERKEHEPKEEFLVDRI